MVITKILGGLGNQLFQYAAGKALSKKLNTPLYLDLRSFKKYSVHKYGLDYYNLAAQPINSQTQWVGLNFLSLAKQKKLIKKWSEPFFHFDERFLSLQGPIYIEGYWQSEKYFSAIKDEIHSLIVPPFKASANYQSTLSEISAVNRTVSSVSLHVRRGDYVTNPLANKFHGTMDINYYKKACSLLQQQHPQVIFFIFSDDPAWCESAFSFLPSPRIVRNTNQYEDLYLMSQCSHNIIANSTFSWWGAWLNKNPHAHIYAPTKWFADSQHNTRDLYPAHWTLL